MIDCYIAIIAAEQVVPGIVLARLLFGVSGGIE
jgi:hypothetical protein